jgi:hypothetical protein
VTLYAVTRVPDTFYVVADDQPLTICWPSGLQALAHCMPVLAPTTDKEEWVAS